MSNIKVTLVQSPIYWEDPAANREMFEAKIMAIEEPTDIIILPEVFTTGFTMEPENCAEPQGAETFVWMQKMAKKKNSVITGSIATKENSKYYNRMIWMHPNGEYRQYNKKHLFTFAGETKNFTPGNEKVIVDFKGWKILLLICYDLRFPVWCKNNYSPREGYDYDCMINIANWPAARSHPWRILLMARAIENQAWVIGVNRIGLDGNGIDHSGDSAVISPLGENFSNIMPGEEKTETIAVPRCQLDDFREKFRVADDWDRFELK